MPSVVTDIVLREILELQHKSIRYYLIMVVIVLVCAVVTAFFLFFKLPERFELLSHISGIVVSSLSTPSIKKILDCRERVKMISVVQKRYDTGALSQLSAKDQRKFEATMWKVVENSLK